jgi:hypothetical protein
VDGSRRTDRCPHLQIGRNPPREGLGQDDIELTRQRRLAPRHRMFRKLELHQGVVKHAHRKGARFVTRRRSFASGEPAQLQCSNAFCAIAPKSPLSGRAMGILQIAR